MQLQALGFGLLVTKLYETTANCGALRSRRLVSANVDFVGPRAHLHRVVPCLHPEQ